MNEFLIVANRIALEVDPPSRILVCPWGTVASKSGGFILDREAADATLAAFKAHGVDLPIDFEHTTVGGDYAAPDGSAPAVGWIKSLDAVDGEGLYANVEWTERGAEWIRTKAYRYLSPVTLTRKKDSRVVGLHSVALTNKPAIVGMTPVVNKEKTVGTSHSEDLITQVRWWLNLPTTATEDEIMNEVEKLLARLREMAGAAKDADQEATLAALSEKLKTAGRVSVAICKAAGVAETAGEADVVAAINSAKTPKATDGTDWQARCNLLETSLKAASDRIKSIEETTADRDVETRINKAKADGKITEADLSDEKKGPELRRMARDAGTWDTFVGILPSKAPTDGRVTSHSAKGGASGGDRAMVINKAKVEHAGEVVKLFPNRESWIRQSLRDAGLDDTLTEDDKKLIA